MSSLNTNTVITNKVYEKTIKIFAKKDNISSLPSTITINVNSNIKLKMHIDKTTSKPFYYIPISDVINYFKNAGTITDTNNNVLFYKYYSSGSSSNSFTIVKNLNELLERITNSNYQLFFIKKSCFENSGSNYSDLYLINETSNITSLIGYSTTSFNKDDYILVHVNYDTIDHETNTSIMYDSHASGIMTNIYGRFSNTEGFKTTVMGNEAHAEGDNTVAIGRCSHAEGNYTIADINNMTSIGSYNKPNYDVYVNTESNIYITDDNTTYTINKQEGSATHKTITGNVITNLTKYANGDETLKDKIFVVGNGSLNNRKDAFVITNDGNAIVQNNLSANSITTNKLTLNSYELNKVINDQGTMDSSTNLENSLTTAKYVNVNKPGLITSTSKYSEIFNSYKDVNDNIKRNIASGDYSHAEGLSTRTLGNYSHAEGYGTTASGIYSHAEGSITTASGHYSHAGGYHTTANQTYQTVVGKYNTYKEEENNKTDKLFIVGNGTADNKRSNAFIVDKDGNATVQNNITSNSAIIGDNYNSSTNSYSSSLINGSDLGIQSLNVSDVIIRKYKIKSINASSSTQIICEYKNNNQTIHISLTYNSNDGYYYFDTKDIISYMSFITKTTPTNYLLFYKEGSTYKTITNFQLLNAHIDSLYLNANCITTPNYGTYVGVIDSNYCQIEINDLFVLSNANNSITLSSIILTNGNTSIKLYIDENNELAVKNVNTNSTATMSLYGTIELK